MKIFDSHLILDHTTGLDEGYYLLMKPTETDLFNSTLLQSRNFGATNNPCSFVFYYYMFGVFICGEKLKK
jgi:hypothetical protein